MDLSVITVSWNTRELLRRCLLTVDREVQALNQVSGAPRPPFAAQVLVVDNASSDGTVAMLRAEFPHVQVIANSENAGFTRGNNQALALAQGRYLFLLNPDTELRPGALCALVDYMESHPRVGIVGPRLYYSDGTPQSSRRRFPTWSTAFWESPLPQHWFPHSRALARYYMLDTDDAATQSVDWVTGAALFVRRAVYEQIGGLDERFFMYSEELDWCYRAKKAGWDIVYLPTAAVTHYEGKSSEQVLAQRDIYFHSSKVRFFVKHRGAFAAETLRLWLLVTFLFKLAEESVKGLIGHKRSLRAARVRAYWQVVSSGLK